MSSLVKQNKRINLILFSCIILAVLNYTAGVFVYRSYIEKVSDTSIVCQLLLEGGSFKGELKIRSAKGLTIIPVDYQIYFYDKKGDTLQLIADSLNGRLYATFDVPVREKVLSTSWYVEGYSNVKVKWLWLSMSLTIPVEVVVK